MPDGANENSTGSNILLRLDDTAHFQHSDVQAAIERLGSSEHEIFVVPKVIYEYWGVATRPTSVNGLGLDVIRVNDAITEWLEFFTLLRDERTVFQFWRDLVTQHSIKGKNAHDARIVAAMKRHAIADILTYNIADFSRFGSIQVWTPDGILAGILPS